MEDLNSVVKPAEFEVSLFDAYQIILERESMIFRTLNMMEEINNILVASIWIPSEKIELLRRLLPSFVSLRPSNPTTKPPTHFEMNSFTSPFQEVVNTYGVPRYQEVNPAIYAIQIFPFLFGLMFGDIGHGGVLLSFSIWLTTSTSVKKQLPSIYNIRYLLLLMGIFSFYCGWIYN
jgi:V-type H+-transporting ATPase subunit a